MTPPRTVVLAAVVGAHGVGGEVRLKLFAESAESLARHRTLWVGARALTVEAVRPNPKGAVARFAEVRDRDAAEALRGAELVVPRDALPPLEQGEYYHADLIGLACRLPDGAPAGSVVAVENFGAGDLIEVQRPDGKRVLVPFKPGVADWEDEGIVVDPTYLE